MLKAVVYEIGFSDSCPTLANRCYYVGLEPVTMHVLQAELATSGFFCIFTKKEKTMRYKILDQNGLNFLTFTIVDWIDLFTRSVYCDMIVESLRFCQKEKGLEVYAYVIMSNHLHLILKTDNSTGLSPIIQSFKSYTANQILKYVKDKKQIESRRTWLLNSFAFNARKNKTHSQHQIWQRSSHPIILYTPKVIRQKLNYIHLNPVRAKIVRQKADYIYSSASNYVNGTGVLDVRILEDIWSSDIGSIDTGGY